MGFADDFAEFQKSKGKSFMRFTEDARKVVVYAQSEAATEGENWTHVDHILLAAAKVLTGRPEALIKPTTHLAFTVAAKRALEQSLRAARKRGDEEIAPVHLLLGAMVVLDETEGV